MCAKCASRYENVATHAPPWRNVRDHRADPAKGIGLFLAAKVRFLHREVAEQLKKIVLITLEL